jgi:hypothetical protein
MNSACQVAGASVVCWDRALSASRPVCSATGVAPLLVEYRKRNPKGAPCMCGRLTRRSPPRVVAGAFDLPVSRPRAWAGAGFPCQKRVSSNASRLRHRW